MNATQSEHRIRVLEEGERRPARCNLNPRQRCISAPHYVVEWQQLNRATRRPPEVVPIQRYACQPCGDQFAVHHHIGIPGTPPPVSDHEDRLAVVAVALAARVGDRDPADNAAWLLERLPDPADWFRLAFVQAVANDPGQWREATQWARHGQTRTVDEDALPYEVRQILERRRISRASGVDEVAVRRFCEGERLDLNRAERRAAVQLLTDQGWSAAEIGQRLGVHPDAIDRQRVRLRSVPTHHTEGTAA